MDDITIVQRPGNAIMGSTKKQRCVSGKPLLSTTQGTLLNGEYCIPKTSLPKMWKKEPWFKQLTVTPNVPTIGKVKAAPFPVFNETEDYLKIPKFLGLKWLGYPDRDERSMGESITNSFKGALSTSAERPQQNAHDLCVRQLCDTGGSLLILPCGFGKTVVSLAVAASLKRKTLVIVAAVELSRQWVERITQFLGCEVGYIQGDNFDVDKNIVVAMLQTLLRRKPDLSMFGTCIVDEAHHIAARSFSQVMPLVTSRYILALSATPNRKDGLKKLLLWTLGDVGFEAKRDAGDGPNAMRCIVTEGNQRVLMYKNGEPARSKMITWLTQDKKRNAFIIHMLNMVLHKNNGRKVLMLTDRREQAEELRGCISGFWGCGLMLGGMKQVEIAQQKECQVLLSTYHYCSEGFDLPRLDTLFLLSPRSDIEQSVGRVLRQHPDKQKPLIIDFVDKFSVFETQSEKRVHYYDKLGCCIKTYDQNNLVKK
jgi:superfamily II DNA or RNA helicase